MAVLLAFPLLGGLVMVQSAIVSRIPILHGTADVVLLAVAAWALQPRVTAHWHWAVIGGVLMTLPSALPFGVFLAAYLLTVFLADLLRRRVWRVPMMAMFLVVFCGTLFSHGLSLLALWLTGMPRPLLDSLNLVTLPSLVLNILLAVPMSVLIGDLARWLYPPEIEV